MFKVPTIWRLHRLIFIAAYVIFRVKFYLDLLFILARLRARVSVQRALPPCHCRVEAINPTSGRSKCYLMEAKFLEVPVSLRMNVRRATLMAQG